MDTMDEIRNFVNRNRVTFLEMLETELFLEGFPGLHQSKREFIRRCLRYEGSFNANSYLLDAMLKVDYFPEQFINFCNENECCTTLKDLIRGQLIFQAPNGIARLVSVTQPSDEENSEPTFTTQMDCVNNVVENNLNQDEYVSEVHCEDEQAVVSTAGSSDMASTQVDNHNDGAAQNLNQTEDALYRMVAGFNAMDVNMDNNPCACKPSDCVKEIVGVAAKTSTVTDPEERLQNEPNESCNQFGIERVNGESTSFSSSFYITSSVIVIPDNEIESLKENPCAQLSARGKDTQAELMTSYSSAGNTNSNSINAVDSTEKLKSKNENVTSLTKAKLENVNPENEFHRIYLVQESPDPEIGLDLTQSLRNLPDNLSLNVEVGNSIDLTVSQNISIISSQHSQPSNNLSETNSRMFYLSYIGHFILRHVFDSF